VDNHSFNEGLGDKLRAEGDAPKTTGKRAVILVILLGLAIVLLAAAGFLAAMVWIGG
jgi:flagellar basal body-associated protein FliL